MQSEMQLETQLERRLERRSPFLALGQFLRGKPDPHGSEHSSADEAQERSAFLRECIEMRRSLRSGMERRDGFRLLVRF